MKQFVSLIVSAVVVLELHGLEIDVRNASTNQAVVVDGICSITGTGGVRMTSLSIGAEGRLILDPVKTPVLITESVPVFAPGSRIALDSSYADRRRGRISLLTWKGKGRASIPENLFDEKSVPASAKPTLTQESYRMNSLDWMRLVVDVDPMAAKPKIRIHPIGDSITEGAGSVGFGAPNYRIALMQKLSSRGYDVVSTGFRVANNVDAAGIPAADPWRWHSGISGARIVTKTGANSRVGFRESIETVLEAAGAPEPGREDLIICFLGANDTGSDIEDTVASWISLLRRIVHLRPSSRILVGSTLYFQDVEWRKSFNARIRKVIEEDRLFPENQVFYVNLEPGFPKGDEYLISPGNQHPSWMGHEITSTCWADAIERVVSYPPIINAETAKPAVYAPNANTGVMANVSPSYTRGFERLYALDLLDVATNGPCCLMRDAPLPYSYIGSGVHPEAHYSKVGYYLELRHARTGHVRWLWADMDTWGDRTLRTFAFPVDRQEQRCVTSLHVDTNDGGVFRVLPSDDSVVGWLQFSDAGFSTAGDSGKSDAPSKSLVYDWNMRLDENSPWGLFQVFRRQPTEGPLPRLPAQTLISYTGWRNVSPHEVGIGDFAAAPQHNGISYLSYTRDMARVSTAAYDLARLEIWAVPAEAAFSVTSELGYDFTNVVVKVDVTRIPPDGDGFRLDLRTRDSRTGALVGATSVLVDRVGQYSVPLSAELVPGRSYEYEVAACDKEGLPLAGVGVWTEKVSLHGDVAEWFVASPARVAGGQWETPLSVANDVYVLKGWADSGARFCPEKSDLVGGVATVDYHVRFLDGLRDETLDGLVVEQAAAITLGFSPDGSIEDYCWKVMTKTGWETAEGPVAAPGSWTIRMEYDECDFGRVRYWVREESSAGDFEAIQVGGQCWIEVEVKPKVPHEVLMLGCGELMGLRAEMPNISVASYLDQTYDTLRDALLAAGVQSGTPVVLRTNATLDPNGLALGRYFLSAAGYRVTSLSQGSRILMDEASDVLCLLDNKGLLMVVR